MLNLHRGPAGRTDPMSIESLKPAVDKKVLVFLAGAVWLGVGAALMRLAHGWLAAYGGPGRALFYAAGLLAALPIHHFGFLRVADKNLARLLPLEEKRCVFSFITWKSYLLVGFMVLLGVTLRHSALPKQYLSLLYNGIGLALALSSVRYFRFFLRLLRA